MINRRTLIQSGLVAAGWLLLPSIASAATGPNIGLIFIGTSWCSYCRSIAPVLHDMQAQTGMEILVASLDNRPIAPFPDFEDGRKHPIAAQFTRVPHIMVYNKRLDGVTHEVVGIRDGRSFIQRLATAMRQSSEMG